MENVGSPPSPRGLAKRFLQLWLCAGSVLEALGCLAPDALVVDLDTGRRIPTEEAGAFLAATVPPTSPDASFRSRLLEEKPLGGHATTLQIETTLPEDYPRHLLRTRLLCLYHDGQWHIQQLEVATLPNSPLPSKTPSQTKRTKSETTPLINGSDPDSPAPCAAPIPVYIRTFGYFDVFVQGKPIAFRRAKCKELLALLTDRRGGYITTAEIIGNLWEDEIADRTTLTRCRKVYMRLLEELAAHGIADIVETHNGSRRLVSERVRSDLFDYLSGRDMTLFHGSYITNYAWRDRKSVV